MKLFMQKRRIFSCSQRGRKRSAPEETATGNIREATEFCKCIVDTPGSLVQICMGGNKTYVRTDQTADQSAFIIVLSEGTDRTEHQRVMGDNQLNSEADSFIDNPFRYIQGKKDTGDFTGKRSYKKTGIVKICLGRKRSRLINEFIQFFYCHASLPFPICAS